MKSDDSIRTLIETRSAALFDELVQIRRHLHRHPELSFEEYKTSRFVSDKLKEFGIEKQYVVAKTGIVALIEGRNAAFNCVALRADMDALPITEITDVGYKSQNAGVMHACGHDVHTTCLLGAAKILNELRPQFSGTIKLIFQPGEEKSPGGAHLMIQEGALTNPKPKSVFGLHVAPALPSGTVGFRQGNYMASSDEIHLKIIGRGGHAALPHLAIDPIAIAATTITALQQIVSRRANPLMPTVLTFGKISGGFATNVIPDEVEIAGTLRTFDEQWRQEAKLLIREIVESIAKANGGSSEVRFPPGYPVLYNNPELTQNARDMATVILGNENIVDLDLRMTAEDFAFYSQKIPSCFFRLGTNSKGKEFTAPVHSAHFDIDETAMITGVKMMAGLALAGLA